MKSAHIVIDLAFGDCGKGSLVDYLTRRENAHTVVRFNGGPQAAHNVVTPDGRHHTFSQFGAGSFVPGVRTLLSRFMLIEPYAMLNEAAHLSRVGVIDPLRRVSIDRHCVVITPIQQAANRLREIARGAAAHGTCGVGVGETMADWLDRPEMMIVAGDLADAATLRRKFALIREYKMARLGDVLKIDHPAVQTIVEPTWIETAIETYADVAASAKLVDQNDVDAILNREGAIVFEGAQGVLLDEWFGFHPHTTWSTTTFANAMTLLDEARFDGGRTRLGVLRSYFTRHGAGPMVSEDSSIRRLVPEPHNDDGGWQGAFRVGMFDTVAARYALTVAVGVDALAITHMDRWPGLPKRVCTGYFCDSEVMGDLVMHRPADLAYQESLTNLLKRCRPVVTEVPQDSRAFLRWLEAELGAPVGLVATGPTARDWSFHGGQDHVAAAADEVETRGARLAG